MTEKPNATGDVYEMATFELWSLNEDARRPTSRQIHAILRKRFPPQPGIDWLAVAEWTIDAARLNAGFDMDDDNQRALASRNLSVSLETRFGSPQPDAHTYDLGKLPPWRPSTFPTMRHSLDSDEPRLDESKLRLLRKACEAVVVRYYEDISQMCPFCGIDRGPAHESSYGPHEDDCLLILAQAALASTPDNTEDGSGVAKLRQQRNHLRAVAINALALIRDSEPPTGNPRPVAASRLECVAADLEDAIKAVAPDKTEAGETLRGIPIEYVDPRQDGGQRMSEQARTWPDWSEIHIFDRHAHPQSGTIRMSRGDYLYGRERVNALDGIEDPAAMRKLLNRLQAWQAKGLATNSPTARLESLQAILDDLYDLIPEPSDDAGGPKT